MDTYIGFDSAWMDNPKAPGAISAVCVEGGQPVRFHPPKLASFQEALQFIRSVQSLEGVTLVALDQPAIVLNATGMRPVDRVAASLVGWLGGGVQPANRGKLGMFCDNSPIWRFIAELEKLGMVQDPEGARRAATGLYLMEVFPALALASLNDGFMQRLSGPKYNPDRQKTFRANDWWNVADTAARESRALGCEDLAGWCDSTGRISLPRKADQDMMDSALCVLMALRWKLRPREDSLLLGDLTSGYMVIPASAKVRQRLTEAARKHSLSIDGVCLY